MPTTTIPPKPTQKQAREIMSAATWHKLNPFAPFADTHLQSTQNDYLFWHKAKQTRKDPQVMACMQQRIYNAVALDYFVTARNETLKAKEIADFVWQNICRLDIDRITEQMLWSRYYGYSIAEIIWENKQGKIMIEAIKPRHPQHFNFDIQGKLYINSPSEPMTKQALPERKFWCVTSGGISSDEVRGEGLCEWLYAPVKMKHDCLEQWQLFLEKYASPTVIGKYPAARVRESEKQALLEAAANIRRDTAAVIPDSMILELLEAKRTGNGEYHPLVDHADRSIAKLILGQTLTTDEGGSYAQANVHDRVRSRLVQADCDLISESFSKQVVKWLCEWNFGTDIPLPILSRGHNAGITTENT